MQCRLVQKQLSAYLDGQLTPKKVDAVLRHAQSCEDCAAVLTDFQKVQNCIIDRIPEKVPAEKLWNELKLRISAEKLSLSEEKARLAKRHYRFVRFFFPQPMWIRVAAIVAVLAIGVVIATKYFGVNKFETENKMAKLNPEEIPPFKAITSPASTSLKEMLEAYFKKSDEILLEIKYYEKPRNVQVIDFSPEKTISAQLVDETFAIKRKIEGTQYAYLKPLVNDLEMIFLDLANIDESKAEDEIEVLRRGISIKNLITKINFVKLNGNKYSTATRYTGKNGT